MLGNDEISTSIPGEIVPHGEYYDYRAKYLEQGTQLLIILRRGCRRNKWAYFRTTPVSASVRSTATAWRAAICFLKTAAARFFFVNELNTIPGFTSISIYPKLWEAWLQTAYPKLIHGLIELAIELHRDKSRTKYSIRLPSSACGTISSLVIKLHSPA